MPLKVRRTRLRRRLDLWLQTSGQHFKQPRANTPTYMGGLTTSGMLTLDGGPRKRKEQGSSNRGQNREDFTAPKDSAQDESRGPKTIAAKPRDTRPLMPFPLNPHFISQSIPSEALRHEVWRRVQEQKQTVRQVSVDLSVEMRRVGAIVRLVELERKMKAEKQQLAIPYAKAIHSMVPTTPFNSVTGQVTRHEPINDLPHHSLTGPQLFYPTSESRAFNRVDAGRVFSAAPRLPDSQDIGQGGRPAREPWQDTQIEIVGKKGHEMPVLKPADARIPHPHLIAFEKDKLDPELSQEAGVRQQRYYQRLKDDEDERRQRREDKERLQEQKTTRIDTDRFQVVVTDVQASREGTGLDGRGTASVGLRYGVPHRDRKRGERKIPSKVEV